MSKTRLILLVLRYFLLIFPIGILINNGYFMEGGLLAFYLLLTIFDEKLRRVEERLNRMEARNENNR